MSMKQFRIVDKLNLKEFTPDQLEYFCYSDDIDRKVMELKGLVYDVKLAFGDHYFIVTTDKRIAILPVFRENKRMFDFEDWRMMHDVFPMTEITQDGQKAIDWFIETVHKIRPQ